MTGDLDPLTVLVSAHRRDLLVPAGEWRRGGEARRRRTWPWQRPGQRVPAAPPVPAAAPHVPVLIPRPRAPHDSDRQEELVG